MKGFIISFLSIIFFTNCQNNSTGHKISLKEISTSCIEGGESNLFVSETGTVYLSWVEYLNDSTDVLMFSILENEEWSDPKMIAQSDDWFVNWADFPSLVSYKDGNQTLVAHWLQKSAAGVYDYDVRIAQSLDGGEKWEPSFIPHRDSIAAEHGFVSMLPLSENRIFATWLDGRNTKGEKAEENSHDHGHGHGGAMTLRTAEFDKNGNLFEEAELDHRICDCCQTDAAMTSNGPIVVYRDRSEKEIRDISIVRKIDGKWTAPALIYEDNWEITGCPVNGPAAVANGSFLAVAWYTAAKGKGSVKVAFSKDGGAIFSEPIEISSKNPLGRVDLLMTDSEEIMVVWVEGGEDKAEIKAAKISPRGKIGEDFILKETSPSRSSGFPRLAKSGDQVFMSWTNVDSITSVRTAKIIGI